MLRFALLSGGAALLAISAAQAHGSHTHCVVGDSWMGVVPHYHSGGNAQAADCQTGAINDPSYGQPPPPRDYGRRHYGPDYYGAPPPPPPRYYYRPYRGH